MHSAGSEYYQRTRTARCCPRRTMGNQDVRLTGSVRAGEQLCCCGSCSATATSKSPGLLATLGICVLVLGYTLLGAFAFMAVEGGLKFESFTGVLMKKTESPPTTNVKEDNTASELRDRTIERLWSITEDLNVLYKENWTRLAAREVLEFQKSLIHGMKRPVPPYESVSSRRHDPLNNRGNSQRWTFSSSLLYSLTLIATIGHGSLGPKTTWGRLITILYVLPGIPLMTIYLSTVGDILERSFGKLYGRICRPRGYSRKQSLPPPPPMSGISSKAYRYDNHVDKKSFYSSKDSSCDDLGLQAATSSTTALQDMTGNGKRHFYPCSLSLTSKSSQTYGAEDVTGPVKLPKILCLLIILLYICGGAVMFHRLEGWSLLEGFYFCFSSLATIGFADMVPIGRNAATQTMAELSLCACYLYILVGVGFIGMFFNLVLEEVVRAVSVFGKSTGMSSGMTVSGQIGGPGSIVGIKSEPDDCLGSSESRLTEHDEDGIAMSVVSAS